MGDVTEHSGVLKVLSLGERNMINGGGELVHWLKAQQLEEPIQVEPLAGDASFRRYFRVRTKPKSFIVMDAQAEKEACYPFIAIAKSFRKQGVLVPEILAEDNANGFLLLTDFGELTYLNAFGGHEADKLYKNAIKTLLLIQQCSAIDDYNLPDFNERLLIYELDLFRDWFIKKQHQYDLTLAEEVIFNDFFAKLIHGVLEQPKVCVHRDYHSRNLMLLSDGQVGVLDFQDAVWGPVSYDLVSLLKDCYVSWPQKNIEQWVAFYYANARAENLLNNISEEQFFKWFHWMGIHRHLKAIGIFARLDKLYGKPAYLQDIPRTLNYVVEALSYFPELVAFKNWLQEFTRICLNCTSTSDN